MLGRPDVPQTYSAHYLFEPGICSAPAIHLPPRRWGNYENQDMLFDLVEAHHLALAELNILLYGEQRGAVAANINVVIEETRESFLGHFPNPRQKHLLPEWVSCYVNLGRGFMVVHAKNGQLPHIPLAELAHEYIHLILPPILGIGYMDFAQMTPTWINEAYTVGSVQRRTLTWLRENYQSTSQQFRPSLEGIMDKGIFYFDQLKPEENIAYQYCVLLTKTLGDILAQRPDFETRYPRNSFGHVLNMLMKGYQNGARTFDQIRKMYQLDLNALDAKVRDLLI